MKCEPVGAGEIAERLGVNRATVDRWRQRRIFPPPRWSIGGRPAWDWHEDVMVWVVRTKRQLPESGLRRSPLGGRPARP